MLKSIFVTAFLVLITTNINAQEKSINHQYTATVYDSESKKSVETQFGVRIDFKGTDLQGVFINMHHIDPSAKSAWIYFTPSQYDQLLKSLKSIRNKFRNWCAIAKENNITDYSKKLEEDITTMPQGEVGFRKDDKSPFYNSSNILAPYFVVDKNGRAELVMAFCNLPGERYKSIDGYIPSITSALLTSAAGGDKERTILERTGFYFSTPEQIQTLIDALDFSKELSEIESIRNKDLERKQEIDALFK